MSDDSFRIIRSLLTSTRPEEINHGLELVAIETAKIGSSEARPLFEMVSTLFYIDVLDHPELAPVVDAAINMAAGFGPWVIPILIDSLDAGDIKAQWAIAHLLGRIGSAAIDPLIKAYKAKEDPTVRAFILYAFGKVKSPEIAKVLSLAASAARSEHLELRDTATRALGKFIESIPPYSMPEQARSEMFESLRENLSDENASVRAKAVRSLGKLAKYGHMTGPEKEQLKFSCRSLIGADESGEWDRAFIVRKEAEEALIYCRQ